MTGRAARPLRRIAPVALLAAGACVATRNDVRILQNDLAVMRGETARADSARRAQLDSVIAALTRTQDTLRVVGTRMLRFQGDVKEDMYNLGQQLVQVQELTGQSQRRLQELRASLEQRRQEAVAVQQQAASAAAPAPTPGAPQPATPSGAPAAPSGAAAPAAEQPGPNQLFQLALDQLRRGSTGAARTAFQDLLRQYPTADVAPDAQFYIGQSYEDESNAAAADSAYATVVTRWPEASRAPTALYKRASVLQRLGRVQAARAALNDVVKRYPRSEEADLARERLKTLK